MSKLLYIYSIDRVSGLELLLKWYEWVHDCLWTWRNCLWAMLYSWLDLASSYHHLESCTLIIFVRNGILFLFRIADSNFFWWMRLFLLNANLIVIALNICFKIDWFIHELSSGHSMAITGGVLFDWYTTLTEKIPHST